MNLGKLLLLIMVFIGFSQISQADDFYYNGGEVYNPYNGLTVMNLPPPPPMKDVPFYVRDDYDDYVEDYYECILGYEYKGMVCRYWRKYAEKNGLYKKMHNQVNNNANNGNAVNNNQNNTAYTPNSNQGYYGNDGAYYPAPVNNQDTVNNNQNNTVNNNNNVNNANNTNNTNNTNNGNVIEPYTPSK